MSQDRPVADGPLGHRTWVFAAGDIPPESTGHEPEMTSRDTVCLLNNGDTDAEVSLEVLYERQDPVGPHTVSVGARRIRHVRVNDLIDPFPVPLGVPYGLVLRSSVPVVVQVSRLDTRGGHLATAMVNAVSVAD